MVCLQCHPVVCLGIIFGRHTNWDKRQVLPNQCEQTVALLTFCFSKGNWQTCGDILACHLHSPTDIFYNYSDTHTHSRSFSHFTLQFSVTHFICFTMVLLPDSPAPGKRTKVLTQCHTFHCHPICQPLYQFTLWQIRNQTIITVWQLGTFRPIKHINSAVASTYTTV